MFAICSGPLKALILGLLLVVTCVADEQNDIKMIQQDSCSFYCFMLPNKDDSISSIRKNIDSLEPLNCTHLVYGYATIDHYQKIHEANHFDYPLNSYWGTYRKLHELHSTLPKIKVLLGVREQQGVHFFESNAKREKVVKNLIDYAKLHYFDGIFLNLRDTNLNSLYFQQFVNSLYTNVTERAALDSRSPKMLVLALNAKDAFLSEQKVKSYADKFDKFYLKGDEALTSESDVSTTILLDPIYPDKDTPFEDTISYAAMQLINNGIPENQIIIGLSAKARGYNLVSRNETSHGAPAYEFARLESVASDDGRFAYQDASLSFKICHKPGADELTYWEKSVATSFVDNEDNWYSLNVPDHKSFERKINYITTHGFGGIGIMNLEADDPNNDCQKGAHPLATYISAHLKCTKKRTIHGGTTECKRMCIWRPNQEPIPFQNFKAEWCSHLVISSANFDSNGMVEDPSAVKDAIVSYNTWSARKKPFLILSIGANMDGTQWQTVLQNGTARHALVSSIWQHYKDMNGDGVSIDYVKDLIGSDAANKDGFHTFLADLQNSKPKSATVFVTVTYASTIGNNYNVEKLNESADYVIIEGYRFHSPNNDFTGHHSPLFMVEEPAGESLRSIEGLALGFLKQGLPNNKIILGFSAEGVRIPFVADQQPSEHADEEMEDEGDKFLGLKVDKTLHMERTESSRGYISQTEVCEDLHGQATNRFLENRGVPVAKKGDEFIAYDDARSIQTKAIWASLNHFAGVSLHAIEMDNPNSICPANEPFNLLQKLVHTQACEACANPKSLDESAPAEDDPCRQNTFRVICTYQLPRLSYRNNTILKPEWLPYQDCSEVVIDEILWMANGEFTFRDMIEETNMQVLANFAKSNPRNAEHMYMIVRCQMTSDELKLLLDNNKTPTELILKYLDEFGFYGVEMRCDKALTNETKGKFKDFVNELTHAFEQRKEKKGRHCPETVSFRIPVWNTDLSEKYELDQLNSMHQVVLETFEHESTHARVVSPLFGFDKSNETHAIDSTVSAWLASGIHSQKIIMQVPSYGLIQTFTNTSVEHSINDETNDYFYTVPQSTLCKMFNEAPHEYQQRMLYDMVSAYATSSTQWFSYETNETLIYRVKFAIQEQLGGVGLLEINNDDFSGSCGRGVFPLLNAINAAICTAPPSRS